MEPIDYGRSFLQGKGPSNCCRFWIESRTRLVDRATAQAQDFFQCGACRSERSFTDTGLFHEDSRDFLPIFGPEEGLIFRRSATAEEGYREVKPAGDMWGGQTYRLVEPREVHLLDAPAAVREAAAAFQPLVGQTELIDEGTGLSAIIEYPIKTMNVSKELDMYQVDTGPVVFPDLSARAARATDRLSLAFLAFNRLDYAEFLVETPAGVGEHTQVYHDAKIIKMKVTNRLYALVA